MPGQFEHPYKRLRTLPDAMAALHGTDRAGMEMGGARARRPVEENFARQRERVQAKIKARHEGRPDQKAMRPAPTDATCGICNGTGEYVVVNHPSKLSSVFYFYGCGLAFRYNKAGVREPLVCCSKCPNFGHPSCLQLTDEITDMIRTYEWTCLECKVCTVCNDAGDDDKMLFCDVCDRGYAYQNHRGSSRYTSTYVALCWQIPHVLCQPEQTPKGPMGLQTVWDVCVVRENLARRCTRIQVAAPVC